MQTHHESTAEELLGPLTELEQKYAPKTLYTAGDSSILKSGGRVSIVGSRKATEGGLQRARRLAKLCAERGVVVVSGLAVGIDTAAHKACMQYDGRTVGVLGTPLDVFYSQANVDLQREIMVEHLCLSQFPKGTPFRAAHFPQRNRTMALICDATVIIEASESSGTRHQGWEALRLGRGLFISTSVIADSNLTWPTEMIRYGAQEFREEDADLFFDTIPPRTPELIGNAALH